MFIRLVGLASKFRQLWTDFKPVSDLKHAISKNYLFKIR